MSTEPILSRPLEIARITPDGLSQTIVANEAERQALAAAYDLPAVYALSAELLIARGSGGLIEVDGRLTADVVQTCVVSLEPVEQKIDEPLSLRFVSLPAGAVPRADRDAVGDIDAPEVLSGPTLDLGALVEEHFVLSLDPYPRAPGAVLPGDVVESGTPAADSPFAALEELGKRIKGSG